MPVYIQNRISRSKARHSVAIEQSFLQDAISRSLEKFSAIRRTYRICWRRVCSFLNFFDMLRYVDTLLTSTIKCICCLRDAIKKTSIDWFGNVSAKLDFLQTKVLPTCPIIRLVKLKSLSLAMACQIEMCTVYQIGMCRQKWCFQKLNRPYPGTLRGDLAWSFTFRYGLPLSCINLFYKCGYLRWSLVNF